MKNKIQSLIQLFSVALVLTVINLSCTKTDLINSPVRSSSEENANVTLHHIYGVLPPDQARYSKVPVYSAAQINSMMNNRLTATAEPASYALHSPAVRDQEQI